MEAVGVCWRVGEWIFSAYMRTGDAYPALKARRMKHVEASAAR